MERVDRVDSGRRVFRATRLDLRGDTVGSRSFTYDGLESSETGEVLEPVTFGRVGVDGGIWLRREDTDTETRRWLVLDSALVPVGHLELPGSGFRVEWSSGNQFIAVASDTLGVPWIVRYRYIAHVPELM